MKNFKYLKKKFETWGAKRRANAKMARKVAAQLFPGEEWKKVEDGIYLSSRRAIGKKSIWKNRTFPCGK
jgi:hypothetical protein